MKNHYLEKATYFADNVLFVDEYKNVVYYSDIVKIELDRLDFLYSRKLVICVASNDIKYLHLFMSLRAVDAICLVVADSLSPENILEIVDRYQAPYVLCDDNMAITLRIISSKTNNNRWDIRSTNYPDRRIKGKISMLLGTSGSTGNPKMVKLTNKNCIENSKSIAKYLSLDCSDRAITTLPPSYTYGLSIILSHYEMGASVAVTNKSIIDKSLWDMIDSQKLQTYLEFHINMKCSIN